MYDIHKPINDIHVLRHCSLHPPSNGCDQETIPPSDGRRCCRLSLAVSGKARPQVAGLAPRCARGRRSAACRSRSSRPRSELQREGDDGATHADHRTPSIHSPQKIAYCLLQFFACNSGEEFGSVRACSRIAASL